jgi:hypothetical protein
MALLQRSRRFCGRASDARSVSSHAAILIALIVQLAAWTFASAQQSPAKRKVSWAWGEAVAGVQCRLRADVFNWPSNTVPELKADVRNQGKGELSVAQTQQLCELEVDGAWYQWQGEVDVKSSALGPGRHYEDIRIRLEKNWHGKESKKPLTLAEGKHTVRVAFLADATEKGAYAVRVESNKVEIEIGAAAQRAKERIRRQQRWILLFNTKDGADYAKQLQGLEAILAMPETVGEKYRVFRDLAKRPINGNFEDIADMKTMYWIDDAEDSVKSLTKALGRWETPTYVVAFFPEKLEQDLLRKESAFAGRKEADIEETKFQVMKSKDGYEIRVVSQKAKK